MSDWQRQQAHQRTVEREGKRAYEITKYNYEQAALQKDLRAPAQYNIEQAVAMPPKVKPSGIRAIAERGRDILTVLTKIGVVFAYLLVGTLVFLGVFIGISLLMAAVFEAAGLTVIVGIGFLLIVVVIISVIKDVWQQ